MSDIAGVIPYLQTLFRHQRIVIWRDVAAEYKEELGTLDLPNVEVVFLENNEYGIKYRLMHLEPTARFLVYRYGEVPAGMANWLLDLELAFGTFKADRESLLQKELGLDGDGLQQVMAEHKLFFRSAKRKADLKALLGSNDDAVLVRAKMTAVLCELQSDHRMIDIVRALLTENAMGSCSVYENFMEFGLVSFFWDGIKNIYGYSSDNPTIDDFVLWVFTQAVNNFGGNSAGSLRNIEIDFKGMRYDSRFKVTYSKLAARASADLNVESQISNMDFREIVTSDLFELYDQKIIGDLSRGVFERTLLVNDVGDWIRGRQHNFWYERYIDLYSAIDSAAILLSAIDNLNTEINSLDDGLEKYSLNWYQIDQQYRRFIFHIRAAGNPPSLEQLRGKVESFYTNKFLSPLGSSWQVHVDGTDKWRAEKVRPQADFFAKYIQPVVVGGRNKAIVIISDALRYEIAEELGSRVRKEDKFDAELTYVLGVLPSYTQLGMAALLPHSTIGHSGTKDLILVDGLPSSGIVNRNKLLEKVQGFAIQAEEFAALDRDDTREMIKNYQVLYIYHNLIDATGDKAITETGVFEAAERTMLELVGLVKKITNANGTNIFITADHGFLYQDAGLDDTHFLSVAPQANEIVYQGRRFVLGKGLKRDAAFKTFSATQLGLDSDLEVQIPKSIHRLRLQGSGSRFVHGGASLQEIVVPVLAINKKRKSDITNVRVEIRPESAIITTGQVAVKVFQTDPVTDKVQALTLRAGLYIGDKLLSNQLTILFDLKTNEKRDRVLVVPLLLTTEAFEFNNQLAEFRLEEQIPNTNQWRIHQKVTYTLKRPFATDF